MSTSGKRLGTKEESSSKRKKRKERNYNNKESEWKASKKKRKDLDKDNKKSRLKVQSVSELADLITSGTIQVPRSLTHYLRDRIQLLDQVFTILSPEDVKGKLPDILKGLKLKQVRQLCYDQLKSMSDDQIVRAIANSETCPSSVRSSENEVKQEPDKVEAEEAMEVGRSADAYKGKWKDAGGDVRIVSAGENVLKDAAQVVLDVSDVSGEATPSQTLLAEPEKELYEQELKVPPVFGETLRNEDVEKEGVKHGGDSGKEVGVGVGGRGISCNSGGAGEEVRLEVKRERAELPNHVIEGGKRKEEVCKTLEGDGNKFDLPLLSGATEDAEQLEMRLRRRALESELRRSRRKSTDKGAQQLQTKESEEEAVANRGPIADILIGHSTVQEQGEMMGLSLCDDFIPIHPYYDEDDVEEGEDRVKSTEEEEGSGNANVGELLEERLRRRALQSMMARRKTKSTT